MFEYSYKRFTPSMKQKVMDFFKALSFSSREMLSIDGIDPRTLYHEFREGWFETCPFCLFKDQKVIAICKVSIRPLLRHEHLRGLRHLGLDGL